jgi:hypothetical protein
MVSAPIQGFLVSFTFSGSDITLATTSLSLDDTYSSYEKMVMDGTGESQQLPGAHTGTLSFDTLVDTDTLGLVEAAIATKVPIPYTITVNEGGATDASYAGSVSATSFTKTPELDGSWTCSFSGNTQDNAFTPAVSP